MSEEIEIEGYKFTVWTDKDKDGYHGHWVCQCTKGGESSRLCGTPQEAIEMAKVHASIHYGAAHERKKP